jgi:hypothetical protein
MSAVTTVVTFEPQDLAEAAPAGRLLTAAEFHRLADVPPEVEWLANLTSPQTRRAYENAVRDFVRFTCIARPEEFRTVTRAHVIAWRDALVSETWDTHRLANGGEWHRLPACHTGWNADRAVAVVSDRDISGHHTHMGSMTRSSAAVGFRPGFPFARRLPKSRASDATKHDSRQARHDRRSHTRMSVSIKYGVHGFRISRRLSEGKAASRPDLMFVQKSVRYE